MDYSNSFLIPQSKTRCIRIVWSIWTIFLHLVSCDLEVRISDGILKGQIFQSREGRQYFSYIGVPYAKPPIGELRFKAPEPVDPWDGTFDATNESIKICSNGEEDRLYLNVYSPKVDKRNLPVMFWIHGGGFSSGYSGPDIQGPEYFMDKDVILVSINYRLGVLGFLSTEDDVISGNYGMKDQVMALRWVQKNIVHFNGDPSLVTIFGNSAGGACVGFHMLSPMSKGLFHKAILQSGSPVCMWATSRSGVARKRAHAIATIAGCNYDTSEDILKCLKKLPANYLMDAEKKLHAWFNHPMILFNPDVENCDSGREAYLCNHPIYDFKQESFVPVIFGMTSAEGGLIVSSLYNDTSIARTEFRTDINRLLPLMLFYNQYTSQDDVDEIGERLLKEYFPSGVGDNTHLNAVNMFTDGIFVHCIIEMTNRLSSPVYGYIYSYQNEFSHSKLFGPCEKSLGVTHVDETISLFKMTSVNPISLNENDLEVSKRMVNIWYKFVISDIPTIDGTDDGTAWPKFTPNEKSYVLNIDSAQPKIIQNPFNKGYQFWSQLFPHYHLNRTSTSLKSPNKMNAEL